jgi:hypothetical protein
MKGIHARIKLITTAKGAVIAMRTTQFAKYIILRPVRQLAGSKAGHMSKQLTKHHIQLIPTKKK